ncbi:MAG: exosortase K [Bacteroidota bacterium]
MKLIDKNIIYYLLLASLFFLLKLVYAMADTGDLMLFLYPVDQIIGVLLNSDSTYDISFGYYHESLQIIIDKSCSGFNFYLIAFIVFAYLGLKYTKKHSQKILMLFVSLIVAYVFTIMVNSSRIYTSIILERQIPFQSDFLHQGIGILTNLTFLILAYFLLESYLTNKKHHEKFA